MKEKEIEYEVFLNDVLSEKGITKYRLSKSTGLSPNVIFDFCLGRSVPSGNSLLKICNILNCQISDIIKITSHE